jgi:hypothetical protein
MTKNKTLKPLSFSQICPGPTIWKKGRRRPAFTRHRTPCCGQQHRLLCIIKSMVPKPTYLAGMSGLYHPQLPSLVPPEIFIPEDAGGRSGTSTRLAHLQLMALQCLLGSTQFAVSCMETLCSSHPRSQLLTSFYSQMLIGACDTSALPCSSHE